MKYIKELPYALLIAFFIFGAFLVNLPKGNYFWGVYDIAMCFQILFLRFLIKSR